MHRLTDQRRDGAQPFAPFRLWGRERRENDRVRLLFFCCAAFHGFSNAPSSFEQR
jgi:hypothetical protein